MEETYGFRNQNLLCTMYRLWVATACSDPACAQALQLWQAKQPTREHARKAVKQWGVEEKKSLQWSFINVHFCFAQTKWNWLNNDALSLFINFDWWISSLTFHKCLPFILYCFFLKVQFEYQAGGLYKPANQIKLRRGFQENMLWLCLLHLWVSPQRKHYSSYASRYVRHQAPHMVQRNSVLQLAM